MSLTKEYFVTTPIGVIVHGQPTYEDWADALGGLQEIQRRLPWVIGDMINYGETMYGQKYAQAIQLTGLAQQTLMNYASVCRRIPYQERRDGENIFFSHHAEVVRLPAPDRKVWLDRVEEEELSTEELRASLREGKMPKRPFTFEAEIALDGARLELTLVPGTESGPMPIGRVRGRLTPV